MFNRTIYKPFWIDDANILLKNIIYYLVFHLWRNCKLIPPIKASREGLQQTIEAWNRPWRFLETLSERAENKLVDIHTRTGSTDLDLKSYRVNDESMCHKWYCIIELVDTDKCILFWSDSNRINIFEYSFQNIKILANSILIINYAFHNWLIWREFPFVWPWF